MHAGAVNYDLIADLVRRASIPVTGNGGVYNRETARRMAETGVAAIMIGRAALANPWLFGDLRSEAPAEEVEASARRQRLQREAYEEHLAGVLEFRRQLVERFPADHVPDEDAYVCGIFRTHLFRYFNGRPGAAEFRRALSTAKTLAEAVQAADLQSRLQQREARQ